MYVREIRQEWNVGIMNWWANLTGTRSVDMNDWDWGWTGDAAANSDSI